MFRLSGNSRRELGKKVLELNGNAVLGFKQYFDLESDQKTITVRSIGTAVKIVYYDPSDMLNGTSQLSMPPMTQLAGSYQTRDSGKGTSSPIIKSPDKPFVSSQGSLQPSSFDERESLSDVPPPLTLPSGHWRSIDPICLTLTEVPRGSITAMGGFVCATSIKVFDHDDPDDIREQWWNELRDEIKSHARKLNCNYVIGYTEQLSLSDDIALLFASGTAVIMDFGGTQARSARVTELDLLESPKVEGLPISNSFRDSKGISGSVEKGIDERERLERLDSKRTRPSTKPLGCRMCHISYSRHESPFPMAFNKCCCCRRGYVPEMLLTTIEPPSEMATIGKAILIEAHGFKD